MAVALGPWAPAKPPPGSKRAMAIRELRIENAMPGALYEVTIPEAPKPFLWRTLPKQLPSEGVSLLIGSCFWLNDDRDGYYSAAVKELVQRERPVFKILMGDQLYADVWAPLPSTIPEGMAQKYERYWGDDAYRDLLAACPTLVSCDDHEFWNDFPQKQIQVPLSWDRYQPQAGDTAAELYDSLPGAAEPRRQALADDRRPAGVVLRRRHPLLPDQRRRPPRPPDARGTVGRSRDVGQRTSKAPASSSSRSRC